MILPRASTQLNPALQGTLPWQPTFVGYIGFCVQNWVRVALGRWLCTTRSASAALNAGNPN